MLFQLRHLRRHGRLVFVSRQIHAARVVQPWLDGRQAKPQTGQRHRFDEIRTWDRVIYAPVFTNAIDEIKITNLFATKRIDAPFNRQFSFGGNAHAA